MNTKLIDNVVLGGVDYNDAPDFCDTYIESADYDGIPMNSEQLDWINEDSQFIYEMIVSQAF